MQQIKVLGDVFTWPIEASPEEGWTPVLVDFLKKCVVQMLSYMVVNPQEKVKIIKRLRSEIQAVEPASRSDHQALALRLIEQYGTQDVGILFQFFMNYQKLDLGQAIIIVPDEPHCYISGQIVECMANSDNVVRCGLTPKYKDNSTLLSVS